MKPPPRPSSKVSAKGGKVVDPSWAHSLIGSPLLVPGSWWIDPATGKRRRTDRTSYACTIVGVDFDDPDGRCFVVECDGYEGEGYPMSCADVRRFMVHNDGGGGKKKEEAEEEAEMMGRAKGAGTEEKEEKEGEEEGAGAPSVTAVLSTGAALRQIKVTIRPPAETRSASTKKNAEGSREHRFDGPTVVLDRRNQTAILFPTLSSAGAYGWWTGMLPSSSSVAGRSVPPAEAAVPSKGSDGGNNKGSRRGDKGDKGRGSKERGTNRWNDQGSDKGSKTTRHQFIIAPQTPEEASQFYERLLQAGYALETSPGTILHRSASRPDDDYDLSLPSMWTPSRLVEHLSAVVGAAGASDVRWEKLDQEELEGALLSAVRGDKGGLDRWRRAARKKAGDAREGAAPSGGDGDAEVPGDGDGADGVGAEPKGREAAPPPEENDGGADIKDAAQDAEGEEAVEEDEEEAAEEGTAGATDAVGERLEQWAIRKVDALSSVDEEDEDEVAEKGDDEEDEEDAEGEAEEEEEEEDDDGEGAEAPSEAKEAMPRSTEEEEADPAPETDADGAKEEGAEEGGEDAVMDAEGEGADADGDDADEPPREAARRATDEAARFPKGDGDEAGSKDAEGTEAGVPAGTAAEEMCQDLSAGAREDARTGAPAATSTATAGGAEGGAGGGDDDGPSRAPCPEFGPGWTVRSVPRKHGARRDRYYYAPSGERFRSVTEVRRFLAGARNLMQISAAPPEEAGEEAGEAPAASMEASGKEAGEEAGEEEETVGGGPSEEQGGGAPQKKKAPPSLLDGPARNIRVRVHVASGEIAGVDADPVDDAAAGDVREGEDEEDEGGDDGAPMGPEGDGGAGEDADEDADAPADAPAGGEGEVESPTADEEGDDATPEGPSEAARQAGGRAAPSPEGGDASADGAGGDGARDETEPGAMDAAGGELQSEALRPLPGGTAAPASEGGDDDDDEGGNDAADDYSTAEVEAVDEEAVGEEAADDAEAEGGDGGITRETDRAADEDAREAATGADARRSPNRPEGGTSPTAKGATDAASDGADDGETNEGRKDAAGEGEAAPPPDGDSDSESHGADGEDDRDDGEEGAAKGAASQEIDAGGEDAAREEEGAEEPPPSKAAPPEVDSDSGSDGKEDPPAAKEPFANGDGEGDMAKGTAGDGNFGFHGADLDAPTQNSVAAAALLVRANDANNGSAAAAEDDVGVAADEKEDVAEELPPSKAAPPDVDSESESDDEHVPPAAGAPSADDDGEDDAPKDAAPKPTDGGGKDEGKEDGAEEPLPPSKAASDADSDAGSDGEGDASAAEAPSADDGADVLFPENAAGAKTKEPAAKVANDGKDGPRAPTSSFPLPQSGQGTLLSEVACLLEGRFPALGPPGADHERLKAGIASFGGAVLLRWSKNVGFLVVGEGPSDKRLAEAQRRDVPIVPWPYLRQLLTGEIPSINDLIEEATSGKGNGPSDPMAAAEEEAPDVDKEEAVEALLALETEAAAAEEESTVGTAPSKDSGTPRRSSRPKATPALFVARPSKRGIGVEEGDREFRTLDAIQLMHLSRVRVGTRLAMYWPEDREYYPCVVGERIRSGGRGGGDPGHVYRLNYEDGETEVLDLATERFKIIGGGTVHSGDEWKGNEGEGRGASPGRKRRRFMEDESSDEAEFDDDEAEAEGEEGIEGDADATRSRRKRRRIMESSDEDQEGGSVDAAGDASDASAQGLVCKCSKSRCLKKWCICYANGARCGDACGCEDCRNRREAFQGDEADEGAAAGSGNVQDHLDGEEEGSANAEDGAGEPDLDEAAIKERHPKGRTGWPSPPFPRDCRGSRAASKECAADAAADAASEAKEGGVCAKASSSKTIQENGDDAPQVNQLSSDGGGGDEAASLAATLTSSATNATSQAMWQCHKCGHRNSLTKRRCKECMGWKGGKRIATPEDGTADDASGPKEGDKGAKDRASTAVGEGGSVDAAGDASGASVQGCKCSKSRCLKKYCMCFANGARCGDACGCEDCGNRPEAFQGDDADEAAAAPNEGTITNEGAATKEGAATGSNDVQEHLDNNISFDMPDLGEPLESELPPIPFNEGDHGHEETEHSFVESILAMGSNGMPAVPATPAAQDPESDPAAEGTPGELLALWATGPETDVGVHHAINGNGGPPEKIGELQKKLKKALDRLESTQIKLLAEKEKTARLQESVNGMRVDAINANGSDVDRHGQLAREEEELQILAEEHNESSIALHTQISELQKDLDAAMDDNARLLIKLKDSSEELEAKKTELETLEDEKAEALAQLQLRTTAVRATANDSDDDLVSSFKYQEEKLRAEISTGMKTVATLLSERARTATILEQATVQKDSLSKEVMALQSDRDALQRRLESFDKLRDYVASLEDEVACVTIEKEQVEAKLLCTEADLERTIRLHEQLHVTQTAARDNDLALCDETIGILSQEKANLAESSAASEQRIEQLESELAQLQDRANGLEPNLREAEEAVGGEKARAEQAAALIVALRNRAKGNNDQALSSTAVSGGSEGSTAKNLEVDDATPETDGHKEKSVMPEECGQGSNSTDGHSERTNGQELPERSNPSEPESPTADTTPKKVLLEDNATESQREMSRPETDVPKIKPAMLEDGCQGSAAPSACADESSAEVGAQEKTLPESETETSDERLATEDVAKMGESKMRRLLQLGVAPSPPRGIDGNSVAMEMEAASSPHAPSAPTAPAKQSQRAPDARPKGTVANEDGDPSTWSESKRKEMKRKRKEMKRKRKEEEISTAEAKKSTLLENHLPEPEVPEQKKKSPESRTDGAKEGMAEEDGTREESRKRRHLELAATPPPNSSAVDPLSTVRVSASSPLAPAKNIHASSASVQESVASNSSDLGTMTMSEKKRMRKHLKRMKRKQDKEAKRTAKAKEAMVAEEGEPKEQQASSGMGGEESSISPITGKVVSPDHSSRKKSDADDASNSETGAAASKASEPNKRASTEQDDGKGDPKPSQQETIPRPAVAESPRKSLESEREESVRDTQPQVQQPSSKSFASVEDAKKHLQRAKKPQIADAQDKDKELLSTGPKEKTAWPEGEDLTKWLPDAREDSRQMQEKSGEGLPAKISTADQIHTADSTLTTEAGVTSKVAPPVKEKTAMEKATLMKQLSDVMSKLDDSEGEALCDGSELTTDSISLTAKKGTSAIRPGADVRNESGVIHTERSPPNEEIETRLEKDGSRAPPTTRMEGTLPEKASPSKYRMEEAGDDERLPDVQEYYEEELAWRLHNSASSPVSSEEQVTSERSRKLPPSPPEELQPLPPAPPLPRQLPSTGYCNWTFDEETRVLLADFRNSAKAKAEGRVTVVPEDESFLLRMMERDDISVVSEGLADGINPLLLSRQYIEGCIGSDYHHLFRSFTTTPSQAYQVAVDEQAKEKKGWYSMKVADYFKYLDQRRAVKDAKSNHGVSIESNTLRFSSRMSRADETFTFITDEGEKKSINVDEEAIYMCDVDMPKLLPRSFADFQSNFKLPGVLPGGSHCMMNAVNSLGRPFMGPNLYISPPTAFTHLHQDGHGTTDSGHLCLAGYNEVIMLRRLTERHKCHALQLLTGGEANPLGILYGLPHQDGQKSQPAWPSKEAIEKCKKMGYYPSVFILKPGQMVHINKGRLHAFGKFTGVLSAKGECPTEDMFLSVAWDWMFKGVTSEGINREVSSVLECARLNREHNVQSLGIPETALLFLAKENIAKHSATGTPDSLFSRGSQEQPAHTSSEPDAETVLRGILPSLQCVVSKHSSGAKRSHTPSKRNEDSSDSSTHSKPDAAKPDAWEDPAEAAINPYGVDDFQCKICGEELSNVYMHCSGCETLLKKDFNICTTCHSQQKHRIFVQMHPLCNKMLSLHNHTGSMTESEKNNCCEVACDNCKFCAGCSCKCHQDFKLCFRFMDVKDELGLLRQAESIVGSNEVKHASETRNRLFALDSSLGKGQLKTFNRKRQCKGTRDWKAWRKGVVSSGRSRSEPDTEEDDSVAEDDSSFCPTDQEEQESENAMEAERRSVASNERKRKAVPDALDAASDKNNEEDSTAGPAKEEEDRERRQEESEASSEARRRSRWGPRLGKNAEKAERKKVVEKVEKAEKKVVETLEKWGRKPSAKVKASASKSDTPAEKPADVGAPTPKEVNSTEEPASPPARPREPSSDAELLRLVDRLFFAVTDKDAITVGDINQKVAKHYGWEADEMKKKDRKPLKRAIKARLTALITGAVPKKAAPIASKKRKREATLEKTDAALAREIAEREERRHTARRTAKKKVVYSELSADEANAMDDSMVDYEPDTDDDVSFV